VVGEPALVAGYALSGATVRPARNPDEVVRVWENLPPETTLVIVTAAAAGALAGHTADAAPLIVVMAL